MRLRKALASAIAVTLLYVAALVWADSRNQVFARVPEVAALLPVLALFALGSYGLRYLRWQWLLRRIGVRTPWAAGWWAYLAGFAFTATPGKVGELLRIRYLRPLGVRPAQVLAAFVFERATDVVAVALLAASAIHHPGYFGLLAAFTAGLLATIVLLATQPRWLGRRAAWLRQRGHAFLSRLLRTIRDGLAGCRAWLTLPDLAVAMALSLAAWTLAAYAFVWLVARLGIPIAAGEALAIYPTAMLVGAASFLPGGVGTTEAAIVVLLALQGVSLGLGTLAAVAIRLASLWFSVLCGFVAVAWLERPGAPHKPVRPR